MRSKRHSLNRRCGDVGLFEFLNQLLGGDERSLGQQCQFWVHARVSADDRISGAVGAQRMDDGHITVNGRERHQFVVAVRVSDCFHVRAQARQTGSQPGAAGHEADVRQRSADAEGDAGFTLLDNLDCAISSRLREHGRQPESLQPEIA